LPGNAEWIVIAVIGALLFGKRLPELRRTFDPADDPMGIARVLLFTAVIIAVFALVQDILR
jgi:hypothetical protein